MNHHHCLTETEKVENEEKQAIDDARTYGVYFLVLNDKWKNNEQVVLEAVKNERRLFHDLTCTELTKNNDFMRSVSNIILCQEIWRWVITFSIRIRKTSQ